jgi:hypothetical protein
MWKGKNFRGLLANSDVNGTGYLPVSGRDFDDRRSSCFLALLVIHKVKGFQTDYVSVYFYPARLMPLGDG